MSLLVHAIRAIQRGWHVFPCDPWEKTPHKIKPNLPYTIRWGEVATNDVKRVVDWWTYSPEANVGIACKPSGLLVLDCDVAKQAGALRDTPWGYLHDRLGPMVDGDDVLRELCQRFGGDGEYDRLMQTYRVCTASMGAHVYLEWPEGVQASQASPVPNALDVRGNGGQKGGYVLGPGSSTEKGMYVVEHDAPILSAAEFPWIVELVREKPKPAKVKPIYSQPGHTTYGGLVDAVRHAQEGNRSNCLYWAARSMYDDGAPEEEAIEVLAEPAQEAGLTYREAEMTIKSGYRGQARKGG